MSDTNSELQAVFAALKADLGDMLKAHKADVLAAAGQLVGDAISKVNPAAGAAVSAVAGVVAHTVDAFQQNAGVGASDTVTPLVKAGDNVLMDPATGKPAPIDYQPAQAAPATSVEALAAHVTALEAKLDALTQAVGHGSSAAMQAHL